VAWVKAKGEMIAAFDGALPKDARVERRNMFGFPVGFVNGNMFAGLHQNRVALRLPDDPRERAHHEHGAQPFEPMPGRVMKEWVVLPARANTDAKLLAGLAAQAFAYTQALPAKKAKPKKVAPAQSKRTVRKPAARAKKPASRRDK
jgi:TfoX/Sxy family transcriptional regulator of competence genes